MTTRCARVREDDIKIGSEEFEFASDASLEKSIFATYPNGLEATLPERAGFADVTRTLHARRMRALE